MKTLILPGYGNSGPDHWQTHWEAAHPDFVRVHQTHWENPRREEWLSAIDAAVERATVSGSGDAAGSASTPPQPHVILVAHSLACLAVAHWGQPTVTSKLRLRLQRRVHAALLVAPPDPDGPVFPPDASDFGPVPRGPLAFPATLVYSSDDPYGTVPFALECARLWQCRGVPVGALGHINSASRLGLWPQGFALLRELSGGLPPRLSAHV